jgi:CelD/BcsL family acetyltransferase involved in cellulose biosynthesis
MDFPVADASPLQVIDLADFAQMRAFLLPSADDEDASADVFLSVDWFEHLAAHGFAEEVRPWLLGVNGPTGSTRFVLPLLRSPDGLRSLSNYYSSLFGTVGCAVPALQAWLAVVRAMQRDRAGAVLVLQPIAEDARWASGLAAALRARAYAVDRFQCFGNWFLPVVHGNAADYLASRPPALRNSVARGQRRLAHAGHSLHIQCGAGDELEEAIAAYEAVYRQSWKQPEPRAAFMPGLMRMAALRGWLRLGVLHIGGQAVAAQVWLVKGGKANIYKLAYVQGFERFSPGSVLTAALMAHVIDVDRVQEVDYLTGDDAYKRDWMSHRRVRVGLVAFDLRRIRGIAAATRHFGGRALKGLLTGIRRPAERGESP